MIIQCEKLFGLRKALIKVQKRETKNGLPWSYENEVGVQKARDSLKKEMGEIRERTRGN